MYLLSSRLIALLMLASPVAGQTTAENGNRSSQLWNEQTGGEHADGGKTSTSRDRKMLLWTGLGFGAFLVIWILVLGYIVWKRESFGEGQLLVVSFFTMFFLLILMATAAAWVVDGILTHEDSGHHLYKVFADGFKVTLGALIGVLTMWSHQSTSKDRTAR